MGRTITYIRQVNNRLFFYAESANEWVISDLSGNAETLAKLKPITQDPALISGAEALRYSMWTPCSMDQ